MLQSIRDRAQGWIAGVIVGFICIPFAMWGVESYMDAATTVVVADVDGSEIELREYQEAYAQYRQNLQAVMGLTPDAIDDALLKRETLEKLVEMELLDQAARKVGMRVGDTQVAAQIHALEGFQEDGRFSQALYEQRLQQSGLSNVRFEEQLRREMLLDQWRQAVEATVFVTDRELDEFDRLNNQTRTIAYAVIPSAPFAEAVEVTDEQVAARYESNRQTYMTDETVVLEYVELSQETIAKAMTIDEAEAREYFEENKANYVTPEERSASHILVSVPRSADEASVKAAEAKARAALDQAKAGTPFDQIAIETSDDTGTAAEGGDLGFFRRGAMVPEFEEAAFAMQPGDLSELVRTDFGFHVIRLNEIKPEHAQTFEEAREEVERSLRGDRAERLFFEQVEQLATLSYEQADTLQPVAAALGLDVQTSQPTTRNGGDGVLGDPKVTRAAFSEEVLEQGINSEPIDVGENHVLVLRVKEHKQAALKPLDEVRERIVEEIKAEQARDQARARGEQLLARLQSGESRKALTGAEGVQWTEVERATRSDPNVSRAVLRAAFRLGRPEGGAAVYGGVPIGTGDYALVAVSGVEDGDPLATKEADRKVLQADLRRSAAASAWSNFIADVRRDAKIKTYPDRL